jgi:hypothetical protein
LFGDSHQSQTPAANDAEKLIGNVDISHSECGVSENGKQKKVIDHLGRLSFRRSECRMGRGGKHARSNEQDLLHSIMLIHKYIHPLHLN